MLQIHIFLLKLITSASSDVAYLLFSLILCPFS